MAVSDPVTGTLTVIGSGSTIQPSAPSVSRYSNPFVAVTVSPLENRSDPRSQLPSSAGLRVIVSPELPTSRLSISANRSVAPPGHDQRAKRHSHA